MLWTFLDLHLANVIVAIFEELDGVDPAAILPKVEDREEVAVGEDHESRQVRHLGVQLHVGRDQLLEHFVPFIEQVGHFLHRSYADSVPPSLEHIPVLNIDLPILSRTLLQKFWVRFRRH